MKRGIIWIVLTCLMVISLVLASCTTKTTSSTFTSTTTTTKTTTTTTKTTTTTNLSTPTATTTTTTGNWWDKLGTPQYGGQIVISVPINITQFDSVSEAAGGAYGIQNVWFERLTADDWTKDPAVYPYFLNYRGEDNSKGLLAESWEFPDPSTIVFHIRQGIHWLNVPPMNGRELTAADIAWNYHRMLGGGDGFTGPTTRLASSTVYLPLIKGSVTAIEKYTVVFKWTIANPEFILETLLGLGNDATTCPPEAVQLWGNLQDWHHAIGTGAFILKDYVSGSSATMVRNPDYWGYDERYPKNKLPYADTLNVLIIPDSSTALAGFRTGKIYGLEGISLQTEQAVQKTNPEILQVVYPTTAVTVDPRNDKVPFNDIRVRQALQMALDLPSIAANYYGGICDPWPSSITSNYMTGWGFPYNEWPQDLKDEYAYNPTAAKKLLADAGYSTGFKTNIITSNVSDMNLLQTVKAYFSAVGIDMSINIMDDISFRNVTRVTRKYDALVFNNSLGITFEPLRHFQRFYTGEQVNYAMVSDPVFDAFYIAAMAATSIDINKKAVRDANEYATRHHLVVSLLTPKYFALYQPWFKGYSAQNFAIGGGSTAPLLLGFYAPRFWIDQNVKTSLGR